MRGLLAAVVLLGSLPTARAQDARLSWVRGDGAASCADAAEMRERVAAQLPPGALDAAGPDLEGVVTSADELWTARIFARDGSGELLGERVIEGRGADCTAIEEAVVLALALLLESVAPAATPPPEPAEPEVPDAMEPEEHEAAIVPPVSPPSAQPPSPSPVTEDPPAFRLAGSSVRAVLTVGVLPQPRIGLGVRTHVRVAGPIFGAVGALYLPEARSDAPNAEIGLELTAFTIEGCFEAVDADPFTVDVCAGAMAGAITVVVHELPPLDAGPRPWGAWTGRARVAVAPTERLFVDLDAGLIGPFVRHRFRVVGRPTVAFQQLPVAFSASLGLGVNFF